MNKRNDGVKVSFKEQMLQAREDAIVRTVNRLLAEKGFDAMTVDEVAAAVGIAKASLYKHFPSKEDLNNFHEQVKRAKGFSPLLIFSHIVGAIFFVARLLSFVWFDLIYAFLVATILPLLILGI